MCGQTDTHAGDKENNKEKKDEEETMRDLTDTPAGDSK